jgi:hypothetical protein
LSRKLGSYMSRQAVIQVLDRALLDSDFRESIENDPDVLAEFDLTLSEREVLLSRNVARMDEFFPSALYCTLRFAIITENIIAIEQFPDEARRDQLRSISATIVGASGNRTDALKELLAVFRQPQGGVR